MTEDVKDQENVKPETNAVLTESISDKERNFRRLEAFKIKKGKLVSGPKWNRKS